MSLLVDTKPPLISKVRHVTEEDFLKIFIARNMEGEFKDLGLPPRVTYHLDSQGLVWYQPQAPRVWFFAAADIKPCLWFSRGENEQMFAARMFDESRGLNEPDNVLIDVKAIPWSAFFSSGFSLDCRLLRSWQ